MKKMFYVVLVAALLVFGGCTADSYRKPNEQPCVWNNNGVLSFLSVKLLSPTLVLSGQILSDQTLRPYSTIYPADGINSFSTLFDPVFASWYPSLNNHISITTSISGCSGPTSKTTTYSSIEGVMPIQLLNVDKPKFATPISSSKVEIVTGHHRDNYGNEGTVIWSTTLTPNSILGEIVGHTVIYGSFKVIKRTMIIKPAIRLYFEDRFIETEI